MDDLEAKALLVADRLDEQHAATYLQREKLRLVLALAWLEGYGEGVEQGRRFTDEALRRLGEELTS